MKAMHSIAGQEYLTAVFVSRPYSVDMATMTMVEAFFFWHKRARRLKLTKPEIS